MKDKQVFSASSGGELGLFLLSTVLHCVSMTVLVYLRRSFGLAFLRPKSFFAACTWAFLLFAVYAWIDGDAWRTYRPVLRFGFGAMVLYWLHLTTTLWQEWHGRAQHDRFSGYSNLGKLPVNLRSKLRVVVAGERYQLWVEPSLVLTLAIWLRVICGECHLSAWLELSAVCLWSKEAINRWVSLRERKRCHDMLADAEEAFKDQSPTATISPPLLNRSIRKEKTIRPRVFC